MFPLKALLCHPSINYFSPDAAQFDNERKTAEYFMKKQLAKMGVIWGADGDLLCRKWLLLGLSHFSHEVFWVEGLFRCLAYSMDGVHTQDH